jgi:ACT domain-containing protein
MAVNLIEQIISSTRSNATERIGKDQLASLYNDLNIDMPTDQRPYSAGLKNRLKREIQRLNRTFFKKGDVIIC